MTESAVLTFYNGVGTDHAGRTFDEILLWDHRRLEMTHDYIQWLFPLPEPSRFNPDAPLLTAADMAQFRSSPALQVRARRALDLMLDFFGLNRKPSAILRAPAFQSRATAWLEPANHNHLRLTRILLFLGYAGLAAEAAALLRCLVDIASHEGRDVLSKRTLSFWHGAVSA